MRYFWSVTDEGLNIYEDRDRVAVLHPSQFVHLMADLSAHIRYTQVQENKEKFMESRKKDAEQSIRE